MVIIDNNRVQDSTTKDNQQLSLSIRVAIHTIAVFGKERFGLILEDLTSQSSNLSVW